MFSSTADWYDLIYSAKNYAEEAERIKHLIHHHHPQAITILDIACGTGEHARHLAADFQIDGIDLEPRFVEIAASKNPKGDYRVADMRSFEMQRRYDVVQCMFSSIGYLLTAEDVVAALKNFARHLARGGIILVEPWMHPTEFIVGYSSMEAFERPDVKISRMQASGLEGDISTLNFQYLINTNDKIRHYQEVHRLALIAPEEMADHFRAAGLESQFDPQGIIGRGLFIARLSQI